jgi:hypothetical protein
MTALDDLRFETRFRACSIHPPIAPPRMRRPNAATANRSVKPADDENLKLVFNSWRWVAADNALISLDTMA